MITIQCIRGKWGTSLKKGDIFQITEEEWEMSKMHVYIDMKGFIGTRAFLKDRFVVVQPLIHQEGFGEL